MMNYYRMAAITPDNSNDLPQACKAIYVGGAGNISIIQLSDIAAATPIVFTAVPVGTIIPIVARRVRVTGTTASLLIALW